MAPKRSIVWEHFERIDKETVLCKMCKKKLKCVNNTSNMRLHLKSKHPTLLCSESAVVSGEEVNNSAKEKNPDDPIPTTSSSSSEVYTCSSAAPTTDKITSVSGNTQTTNLPSLDGPPKKRCRQLKLTMKNIEFTEREKISIDRALVKMVGKDLQPLSIVDNEGFREYTEKLQPNYTLPSRKTLTNKLIPEICNDISKNIRDMLDQTDNVGITTDIWSSDSNKSYITVTCHFINTSGEQENVVLDTKEIPGSHTADAIAAAVQKVFNNWNISDKVTAIVTDNGSNVKKAVVDNLKKTHIPCVGHTLNLCVTDAIDQNVFFKESLRKCKKIVSYFKSSNLASDKLKEVQDQMSLPNLKVIQDVSTRWNSSLAMIERLLEIREPLSVAMSYLPNAPEPIDASEWQYLKECAEVLQPLHTMTEELSGETYPTLSMVIPLLRSIQHALKSTETLTDVGLFLKTQIVEVISRRFNGWEDNRAVAAKATFLDPRFMKTGFGLSDNADMAEKYVTDELESMKNNSENTNEEDSKVIENQPPSGMKKKDLARKKLWEWVDKRVEENKKSLKNSATASSALTVRHYLELPQPERWKTPLPFCAKHQGVLPEIYYLQKKYLCLPATSVPSERLFSTAGQVTNDRRNRLDPKNLNNILFLHSNMK